VPKFTVSPSRIARYYFHECDRYLRYTSTPKERRAGEGVPAPDAHRSAIGKAILDGGYRWEERILDEFLVGKVLVGTVEARCDEVVWRRSLARGATHSDVEAALANADKLYPRVALALFDDAARAGDVLNRLNRMGSRAGHAFVRCNRGAHEADPGDPVGLVNDTQFLVDGLDALS
jgi:hypothetical protein